MKNIVNLTKMLSKEHFSKLKLFEKTEKKTKKTVTFWLLIMVILTFTFISYKIIDALIKINQPYIFLNIYWFIASIIILFEVALLSGDIYYFSKDINLIMPLPVKPYELLISKFLTLILNMYLTEAAFLLFPMIIYGIMTYMNILSFLYLFVILLIFPIMPTLIISILTSLVIKLTKTIKNKNIFQIMIVIVFIGLILIFEITTSKYIINSEDTSIEGMTNYIVTFNDKIRGISKYFIQVNDIVDLIKTGKLSSILKLLKIIIIDCILMSIFVLLGEKFYFKDILKNNNFNKIKNRNTQIHFKKIKKHSKTYAYIKKEIKTLIKNPIFFMQGVFPIVILIINLAVIIARAAPPIREFMNLEVFEGRLKIEFGIKEISLILSVIQMIYTMSNISITSISREGKDAVLMKSYPISLYKQYTIKTYIEIIINSVLIVFISIFIKSIFSMITIIQILIIIIISILLNVLNSKMMVLFDMMNPNLNWNSENEVTKNNKNKIYQYAYSIFIILFLIYSKKIFKDVNIVLASAVISSIIVLIMFIVNLIVKLNIEKIFNKKIN